MIPLLIIVSMIVGAALYALIQFVTRSKHHDEGENALQEMRRAYYGDIRRRK